MCRSSTTRAIPSQVKSHFNITILLLAFLWGVLPAVAQADIRGGTVSDARDTPFHENVDGTSYHDPWDIAGARWSYDPSGSAQLTLSFYDPIPAPDKYDTQTYSGGLGEWDFDTNSCFATRKGDLNIMLDVPPDSFMPGTSMMWLTDYDGKIPMQTQVSPDRRIVTVSGSIPALANRPYSCGEAGDISTGGSADCNAYRCWDAWHVTTDRHAAFRFDGLKEPRPTLTKAETAGYLRTALRREFKGLFRGALGYRAPCVRASSTKFRCKVSWGIGDFGFSGRAAIWLTRERDGWDWNYSWNITRFDEYCALVLHRAHGCVKRYRVK